MTVTIEKTRSGVTYADTDEATATAAQDLAEQGVFTGCEDRREVVFRAGPDRQPGGVLGHGAGNCRDRRDGGHQTGFCDDDAFPPGRKAMPLPG